MLGEFVDDYTVRVVDVFAMPQSGTGVSVEAVDPVFQTKMLDMLKQTGRCASSLCWQFCLEVVPAPFHMRISRMPAHVMFGLDHLHVLACYTRRHRF